jgi:hypothetical protein
MLKAIWTLSNSKLGLLIIGFALTTVIGAIFTDWIQRRSWQYQTELEDMRQDFEWKRSRKFELLERKLEGQKSLEQISDLINLRFFRLQEVYESILATNLAEARRAWVEYMEAVESWNVKLIIYQNKLARLVDVNAARQFNNYETDNSELSNPSSLHGHFFLAHKSVREIFECALSNSCQVTAEMKKATDERLRSLDYFSDAFVDNVSSLFLERTFALEEFRNL